MSNQKVDAMKTQDDKTRISIRWKVLIGFTVLFTVIYFIALNMFTNLAVDAADQQVQQDLEQVLEGTAGQVDVQKLMDLADTGEPNEDGFSDDPRFVELLGFLVAVQKVEPDAWPYLYIPSENENEIYFVVDVWAASDDPDNAGGFLEAYTSNSGFIIEGLTQQTYRKVDHRIVQDLNNYASSIEETRPKLAENIEGFGDWLTDSGIFPKKDFGTYCDKFDCWASGYTPLELNGNQVAAIGVDFQADYLNQVREEASSQVRNAFLYSYPVLLILIFLVTSLFTQPLLRLSEGAERIAEGDYEVDFSNLTKGRFSDEIDTLAGVFKVMVDKVRAREVSLRREVAQLRIEIDQTKKQSEVAQIVDSDFFKDLQSRASDLRRKRDSSTE